MNARVKRSDAKDLLRILALPAYRNRRFNPYSAALYEKVARAGCLVEEFSPAKLLLERWDIWHIHWPDLLTSDFSTLCSLKRAVGFLALLPIAKLRGIRIVWTIHNLRAHDVRYPWLHALCLRCFVRAVDGYLSLTATARDQALQQYPQLRRIPGSVTPHGHYRDVYPAGLTREAARRALDLPLEDKVFVFFGLVRPYKNVLHLVHVFKQLPEEDVRLVVAGYAPDPEYGDRTKRAALADERIICQLEYVEPANVQVFMRSADLVVLPYADVLNSGAALLALSFGVPILVPSKGSMHELVNVFGERWVRIFDRELTADVLADAMRIVSEVVRTGQSELHAGLASLEWSGIADATVRAYRRILSKS